MLSQPSIPSGSLLELTPDEHQAIADQAQAWGFMCGPGQASDSDLTTLELGARELLPERVLGAILHFRRAPNRYGFLLLRNLPIGTSLPETPRDGRRSPKKLTKTSELVLTLAMLLLGEPIAYADEKEGALIQDICPVPGQENKQENTGSTFLEFHTEDGFHPFKPDYIGLLCLRGDRDGLCQTATASIRNVMHLLPSTALTLLRQPMFRLRISSSFGAADFTPETTFYSRQVPVLTGSMAEPDMCIDFFLMEAMNEPCRWALDVLKEALIKVTFAHRMEPGDLMIIDNRMAAHARTGFTPRYDGKDRWLQRMFVIQDLRKTSFSRFPGGRICTPLPVEYHLGHFA